MQLGLELKPRDAAPAAPSPFPSRCKAGNEMEPPAAFSVATGGSRFRHPRPAPVGDLDPDNAVQRVDRDRHPSRRGHPSRYAAGYWRKARSPARRPRPRSGARGRLPPRRMLGRPAPAPPARPASVTLSRTATLAVTAPALPRPPRGNRPGTGRTQGNARSSPPRTSSRRNGLRASLARGSSVAGPPVRGRP
jgi:hypothetical protein